MSEVLKNAIIANYEAIKKLEQENTKEYYGDNFFRYVLIELSYKRMYDKYILKEEFF